MNITDVRVRKVAKEGKMKAVVSITIDEEFVVHDIKVIEGEKGLFIAMPSRKATDGEYRDIAHPINSSTRDKIQTIILEKYQEAVAEEEAAVQDLRRDEGEERHAGNTDENKADHRADHAEKQFRGHVLQAVKDEADEAEHHDVEGVRLVERIAVKEPERAEDDTEDVDEDADNGENDDASEDTENTEDNADADYDNSTDASEESAEDTSNAEDTSSDSDSSSYSSGSGSSVVNYATQFVGNPYVWGGTSLTNGADCSGFVQQIYKNFGYNLPRVAEDQSQYGTKIPVEDAQPGDLIFYAKDGYVHHVVMYAGDGKTIEAANEDQGIISGTVYIPEAVWATRILEENYNLEGTDVNEQNATAEQYGDSIGEYTIDYYCSCETCRAKASKVKATGTPVVEGQTIAIDPDEIPYGTKVIIDGHVFTAEDYDTAGKEKHISIYVNEHETAQKLNEKKAEVHLVK